MSIGEVQVSVADDANHNSPVVLGVVVVADAELFEKRVLGADRAWLDLDADLALAYPKAVQAFRCELTAGQDVALPAAIFKGQRGYVALVLANMGNSDRRARIDGWHDGGTVRVVRENWELLQATAPPPTALRRPEMQCKPSARAN